MNEHINFQIIRQSGKPAFAVVPYDEFVKIYPQAEEDSGIPHSVVRKMVHKDISRIRAWREQLGMTQKAVASKLGITQAAYSQMEAVGANPRETSIKKIAKIFGLTSEQLQ